jgi:hypothetical protein
MSKKSTREEAVELAHGSAQKQLRAEDPEAVAERSGAEWHTSEGGGYLEVPFLNRIYRVLLPDAAVSSRTALHKSENTAPLNSTEQGMRGPATGRCRTAADEAGEEPPLVRRVLILHYLLQAHGTGLAGRWVDFRSLPGGVAYYPVFRGRVISRLVRMFGERPQALIPAAAPLGGRPIEMADVAVEIPAFPRVPVVLALWKASEEFGPEGTVMFDDALPTYLETEDAIIVCEEILGGLKHNVQSV